jgi:hypothetical protein
MQTPDLKCQGQNKSKSKFTPRPRDIKILAICYKKLVAKQEYFANTANTALN